VTDEEYLKKLGSQIAQKRKLAGLSQGDLGLRCGMDRQNLSNIERGKKNIQALTIRRLADVLGMEAWELMKFE
jgi:transcriptional regulator with XRE-family HTH domain